MQNLADDEIVHLGTYAEELLASQTFHRLVALFQMDAMERLLSTELTARDERERLYLGVQANAEFGSLLQTMVRAKDKLLGERKPVPHAVEGDDTPRTEIEVELSDEAIFSLVEEE